MDEHDSSRDFWTRMALDRTSGAPRPAVGSVEASARIDVLDDEIAAIAYALAAVKTRRNALVRAAVLPPEVLARIFEIVRDIEPIGRKSEGYKSLGWYRITRICGHWRRAAVQHATLWGKLTLEVQQSGLWEAFRTRAGNAPVDIYLSLGHYEQIQESLTLEAISRTMTAFGEVISHSTSLVRSLTIEADTTPFESRSEEGRLEMHPSALEALLPLLLHKPADRLKRLVLLALPSFDGNIDAQMNTLSAHVSSFLKQYAPSLENVMLQGFPFPWDAYSKSHIRRLKLAQNIGGGANGRYLKYNFPSILEYLRESPQLEELDLEVSLPFPHATANEEPTIALPRMKYLRLVGASDTHFALWRLLRVHTDARSIVVLHEVDNMFDFPSISHCLTEHIHRNEFDYDTLQLSALSLRGGYEGTPSLIIDLFDKSRKLYRPRVIYSQDRFVGLEGSHHPGFHIALIGVSDHNAFDAGASDVESDLTDTNLDPAPFHPRRPRTIFRCGPSIVKEVLSSVEMSHLRSLKLSTRLDMGCPWTARFLRSILKRATALEHIRLDVSMRDLIVSAANALKPNADASRPPPAPALRTLYVENAVFDWNGGEPQPVIFNEMLEQRSQRHLGPRKLKLRRCKMGNEPWATQWRALVEKVIWDGYGTDVVGQVGDVETSDWAASDEENVSPMLPEEDVEDDWWSL
ncbi:unnamed protein product [Peniophora sp. CBMAI 1063]|nr:unnamed protein product [Peniophora sp. CBMAI 1063]